MMIKLICAIASLFFVSLSYASYTQSEFFILPNIYAQKTKNADLDKKIITLVKNNIATSSSYSSIRIRPVYANANQLTALIVYYLSSQYKSVEVVRINLDANLKIVSIDKNYHVTKEDLMQSPNYAYKAAPKCPDSSVQFILGNNFGGDASVEKEITAVYQLAKQKGYNPVLMDVNNKKGPQPTVQAYENWFSCPNVKGFYNESHGYEQGIVLSDDDFVFSMVDRDLVNKLNRDVIVFDSCLTFLEPLLDSMTNAKYGNAQKYMAGTISLPFGASERTASCFWKKAMAQNTLTQKMISDCAADFGLGSEDFSIKGNGSDHLIMPV